jgi:cytochrome c
MRPHKYVSAVIVVAAAIVIATAQTSSKGKQLFESRCTGCHSLDTDKEGPRLRGVYGRAAASVSSFEYSEALKASKIEWNDQTLDEWLTDPDKRVPGSGMAFRVQSADERAAVIAYLKQVSGR